MFELISAYDPWQGLYKLGEGVQQPRADSAWLLFNVPGERTKLFAKAAKKADKERSTPHQTARGELSKKI